MTILGDQSPWNGGLLRAQALRQSGINFTYQHHDADLLGVMSGGPTGVSRGNPPYFSLACRLPMSLPESNVEQRKVIDVCKKASIHPVVYMQYKGNRIIKGSQNVIGEKVTQMFHLERDHLSAVSGKDLPKINSIEDALKLHANGVTINSVTDMFRETPPFLLKRLGSENFWGIDDNLNRLPYTPGRDWYAIIPRGITMPLEFALRGLTFTFSNCPYKDEVILLRDTKLHGTKIKVLQIKLHWNTDFLGEHTPVGKAWRKKGQPDFSGITNYWSGRPTSMGVLAFGGNVCHTLEEEVW